MKTYARLLPFAPAFAPPRPGKFPASTFTGVKAVPVQWPSPSEDFFQTSVSPSAPRSAEAGSIYTVDDNEGLTELYTILLEARGYTVRSFDNRADALAGLESDSEKPNLLIMDCLGHSMPVDRFMHRCLAVHPTLRILMASGLSPAELRFSGAWPDRFIQKPFTGEEFLKEVKAALAPDDFRVHRHQRGRDTP